MEQDAQRGEIEANEVEEPQDVPAKAWVTMVGIALFIALFGFCSFTFMFN